MSALKVRHRAKLQPSQQTIELRLRVERLEFARRDAITRRNRAEVELIDNHIAQASAEWTESFAADHAESYRKSA